MVSLEGGKRQAADLKPIFQMKVVPDGGGHTRKASGLSSSTDHAGNNQKVRTESGAITGRGNRCA